MVTIELFAGIGEVAQECLEGTETLVGAKIVMEGDIAHVTLFVLSEGMVYEKAFDWYDNNVDDFGCNYASAMPYDEWKEYQ